MFSYTEFNVAFLSSIESLVGCSYVELKIKPYEILPKIISELLIKEHDNQLFEIHKTIKLMEISYYILIFSPDVIAWLRITIFIDMGILDE
ncbi:unnamed protein product [Schistosoma spindalis]|nr:unnamed protein product [Schistosoma spindale]